MKNLLLFIISIPLISLSQVNCDTVYVEPEYGEYTHTRTRGYWFRANSSFTISAVRAADGDSTTHPRGASATNQSIEIIQFTTLNLTTDTIPLGYNDIIAGLSNPHTSLFHAQNVPLGWVSCNVDIIQDRYYAILGAKNAPLGTSIFNNGGTDMYNATLSSGGGIKKLFLNGDSTVFWRAAIQESLADGPGSQGQFFHDGPHSQARIHTLICSGPSSWDCVGGACLDPGTGLGTYTSLSACQANCIITPTWDCVGGACLDPGTGLGTYTSLSACQANCVLPTWDCVGGACLDPGTGFGTYTSLSACQANCIITPTWDCVGGTCLNPGTGLGTYTSLSACLSNCTNTSIKISTIEDFNIYPNPNEGIFRVSFTSNPTELIELRVINPLGEELFFDKINSFDGEYDKKISLVNYAKGIYFISLNSGSEMLIKKIIIN